MTEFYNRGDQKALRQRLRKERPPAEALLWSRLKGRQLLGQKFRRQHSVGPYCLDFYCPEIRLAVELDGDSHFTDEAKARDLERQRWIESFGIRFLRFINVDVYDNLDGVLQVIATAIEETPLNPPFARGDGSQGETAGG